MQNTPLETRSTPGMSSLPPVVFCCLCSHSAPPVIAIPAKNRLMYRPQRQDRYDVSAPPSSSPTAAPAPAMAPYTPNALPRSFGSVKVVVSSDSAAGASIAANTPWQARAVTSISKLTDAPPIAEATAKPVRPVRNIRCRPTRSASRPQNSSRLPNDSEYAVTIHCLSTSVKCSAFCADGSARFITVRSSTIMSWATAITTRISQRRGSGSACPGAPPAQAPWALASDMSTAYLEDQAPLTWQA